MDVDIKKLEKLSCLALKEEDKSSVQKSLEGVFDMMKELEALETPSITSTSVEETVYRTENLQNLVNRKEEIEGLHQEEGFFLAPKVIKK